MLFASATSLACAAHPSDFLRKEEIQSGPDTYTRFSLKRADEPDVRYYFSAPRQKAPLVLYIQGSGCTPVFVDSGGGNHASTVFSLVTLAHTRQYAVMVVDKPHAPAVMPGGGCPKAFNDYFSFDTWLATVKRALRHALTLPDVDANRVLVIGISEGATVASALARDMAVVSDVALVGATGPTQFYDFIANVYRSEGNDAAKERQLRELDDAIARINDSPQETGKFEWGHTYKRWSSFFKESSVNNLLQSHARVYLASGMSDQNVPMLSTEVMYAQLRAQGRSVRFRRIPFAGHNLVPDGVSSAEMQKEFDALMSWFAGPDVPGQARAN